MRDFDIDKIFAEKSVMPMVILDGIRDKVIAVRSINRDSYEEMLKTHRVWYYDGSADEIKMTGQDNGNTQRVIYIKFDNNFSSVLVSVEQKGFACCENGKTYDTCFINETYRRHHQKDNFTIKHKRFEQIDIDKNFDYSKEDYE